MVLLYCPLPHSLMQALMSDTDKTKGTTDDQVTDGIDIKMWTCANEEGRPITYSTWDFAGQDIYYNTHQVYRNIPDKMWLRFKLFCLHAC